MINKSMKMDDFWCNEIDAENWLYCRDIRKIKMFALWFNDGWAKSKQNENFLFLFSSENKNWSLSLLWIDDFIPPSKD